MTFIQWIGIFFAALSGRARLSPPLAYLDQAAHGRLTQAGNLENKRSDPIGVIMPSPPTHSLAATLQPCCRLLMEKCSCAWRGRSLNVAPPGHLDSTDFSLMGKAGGCFTLFIPSTHQKLFSLPLTAFTVAVRLYDAVHSMHSKSISVFIAQWSVQNG